MKAKQWSHIFVAYDGTGKAAGTKVYMNGKLLSHNVEADGLSGTIQTPNDFRIGRRSGSAQANNIEIDDVRLYNRALTSSEVASLAGNNPIVPLLAISPDKRNAKQKETLLNHYLNNIDKAYQKITADKRDAEKQVAEAIKNKVTSMIMGDMGKMRATYLLERGHYEHPKKDEVIKPGVPALSLIHI